MGCPPRGPGEVCEAPAPSESSPHDMPTPTPNELVESSERLASDNTITGSLRAEDSPFMISDASSNTLSPKQIPTVAEPSLLGQSVPTVTEPPCDTPSPVAILLKPLNSDHPNLSIYQSVHVAPFSPQYQDLVQASCDTMPEHFSISHSIVQDMQDIVNSPTILRIQRATTPPSMIICEHNTEGQEPSSPETASTIFEIPPITTYADATNLALRYPEHAMEILHKPLIGHPSAETITHTNPSFALDHLSGMSRGLASSIHAPRRHSEAMSGSPDHTPLRPNWARSSLPDTMRSLSNTKYQRKRGSNDFEGVHTKRRRPTEEAPHGRKQAQGKKKRSPSAAEARSGTVLTSQSLPHNGQRGPRLHNSHLQPVHSSAAVDNSCSSPLLTGNLSRSFIDHSLPRRSYPDDTSLTLSVLFQEALRIQTPASEVDPLPEDIDLVSLEPGYSAACRSAEVDGSRSDLRVSLHRWSGTSPVPYSDPPESTSGQESRYPITFRSDASLVAPSVLDDMTRLERPASPRSNQALNRFAWQRLLVGPTEAAILDDRLVYPDHLKSAKSKIMDSHAVGCSNPCLPRDIEASGSEQAKVLGILPHAFREGIWGGDCFRASIDHTAERKAMEANDGARWMGKRSSYGSINIPLPSVG